MKKYRTCKKAKRSFDPKQVAIVLAEALKRDLQPTSHVLVGQEAASLFCDTQIDKFLSKFTLSNDQAALLETEAFEKFLEVNQEMAVVNSKFLNLRDDSLMKSLGCSHEVDLCLRRARALAHFVLSRFDMDEFFLGCKSSQGSSIGVSFSDTSPERKYSYPISVSHEKLVPLWRNYMKYDSRFSESIRLMNSSIISDEFIFEGASRATTVDKSTDSRRMIAVEPVVNMFFQQGLHYAMRKRLESVGIDLPKVPAKHERLAFEGSITSKFDTIDFSSASDRVSREFLKWLIPPQWFAMIDLCRSSCMKIQDRNIDLEMISTMGNATTFPIETLVFWCIATSVARTVNDNGKREVMPDYRTFSLCSVFGDDCILPAGSSDLFIEVSETVGFVVNRQKSFYNGGHFRESCGSDYFHGVNIRPVFLRAPHNQNMSSLEPWLYSSANGLLKKYRMYFGDLSYVYDKELFKTLFRLFNQNTIKIKIVPDWFPDDSGLKIASDLFRFQRHYSFSLSTIAKSVHGTYKISYCRFRYRQKEVWNEYLRYSLYLKGSYVSDLKAYVNIHGKAKWPYSDFKSELKHEYPVRRIGGYVVASALTSHLTVKDIASACS